MCGQVGDFSNDLSRPDKFFVSWPLTMVNAIVSDQIISSQLYCDHRRHLHHVRAVDMT